ncbi:MAG: hypothetical protein GY797_22640 [Deltaproteobacteria bacterium]|nr:hypothetical protein [Deltaproteobacteria bacterium]
MTLYLNRLFRAAKLDTGLYDEVMADKKAQFQAMMTVFIYSMAAAYGSFGRSGTAGINFGMITTLFGWYVWAFSTYFIGTRLLPGAQSEIERKSLLRVLGFASSPGLIRLLGLVPGLSGIIFLIATIWMIATSTVALKQVLNFESVYRAAGVCVIAWIISAIFQGLLYIILLSVFGISTSAF